MSSPVEVETKEVYSIENYGSALAPFYTNLATWVGGIVLIAISSWRQIKKKWGNFRLYRDISGDGCSLWLSESYNP